MRGVGGRENARTNNNNTTEKDDCARAYTTTAVRPVRVTIITIIIARCTVIIVLLLLLRKRTGNVSRSPRRRHAGLAGERGRGVCDSFRVTLRFPDENDLRF